MKNQIQSMLLLSVLLAGMTLLLAVEVTAQTVENLHSFALSSKPPCCGTNSDGTQPVAGLVLSDNTLYGTASQGGAAGDGTIFKVTTNGAHFTILHTFTPISAYGEPLAGLVLSGNTLYGTTGYGGDPGQGTVFRINTDGTGFTNLHSFSAMVLNADLQTYTNSDGAEPQAPLILSGNTLYGTAFVGGAMGNGTVFKINTDGTSFTNLHSFTSTSGALSTNDDGAGPLAGLILSGSTLYGTTWRGGSGGDGIVFRLNSDGSDFTNLHSFASLSNSPYPETNKDGALPRARLLLVGNTLYGTADSGGSAGYGTVFKINTDGTDFTNLHIFTDTNGDGAWPDGGLICSGNTLYGMANGGGAGGSGMIYKVNTDGSGYANVYSFTAVSGSLATNEDGARPYGELILSNETFYGTASAGGSSGSGTVFKLLLGSVTTPQLTITCFGSNAILTWPTNSDGFNLQSATNLVPSAVWNQVLPGPSIVAGQYSVTNPIIGPQKFYRLSP